MPTEGCDADRTRARALHEQVLELRRHAIALEAANSWRIDRVHPAWKRSAANLVHYLAVRQHDLRPLQADLARLGLSSLGRMEAHTLATLDAVAARLDDLLGGAGVPSDPVADLGHDEGDALLDAHADALLGPEPEHRWVRTMVTLPSEAADDPDLVAVLADGGMDIARVNAAHDGPEAWRRMLANVRTASQDRQRACLVAFDLAGPKLRTGPLDPDPKVLKFRPRRDALGRVQEPARLRLVADGVGRVDEDGAAVVPVTGDLAQVRAGDVLRLVDARGRKRRFDVAEAEPGWCDALGQRTAYLVPGAVITIDRAGVAAGDLVVGDLPAVAARIEVRTGEPLLLLAGPVRGRSAVRGEDGSVAEPARIGCTQAEVVAALRSGERVLFDDGRIEGVARSAAEDDVVVVDITRPPRANLKAEKGINVPDTLLDLGALSDDDVDALAAVSDAVDLVSLSFVQRPGDVARLLELLEQHGATGAGVVLKIETNRAFEQLPLLLLEAMRHPKVGVMLARGDLAVELGFERLAEVQEEILWLCEAAHVPVVWATQVLESLAKGGVPTRAEITDAATGGRAECVMLNKGPHVPEALRVLDDVLRRMQQHQDKRTGLLRRLRVSDALDQDG